MIEVLRAHDIRYFLYNGGNDSADTSLKIAQIAQSLGYPLHVIGVPKTVDNDLPVTDSCPGFGSVAKYTAVSVLEASLDVESMCESSTKVFVMEVMGRHAGWIAAAAGLAGKRADDPPHIILFPEIAFDEARFLARVRATVERVGYCTVVVSEGLKNAEGKFLAEAGSTDAFGHTQLGGVGPLIAQLVKSKLGYKYHWAVPDYLQRSARHLASKSDAQQAYAVGKAAVEYALAGKNAVMPVIKRVSNKPFRWKIEPAPLTKIANIEKKLPKNFITRDGFGITAAARAYFEPLIRGEDTPPYDATTGLPKYAVLKRVLVKKKLPVYTIATNSRVTSNCCVAQRAFCAAPAILNRLSAVPTFFAPHSLSLGRFQCFLSNMVCGSRWAAPWSRSFMECGRAAGFSADRPAMRACRKSPRPSRKARRPTSTGSTRPSPSSASSCSWCSASGSTGTPRSVSRSARCCRG